MKKKNYFHLVPLFCGLLILSSCKKNYVQIGVVQAAVEATCGTNVNYQGTHVFAYLDTTNFGGSKIVNMLIGGYNDGEKKELGFIIPWPTANGTVLTNNDFTAYYDPQNNDGSPNDGDSEYGSSGSGSLTITNITMDNDGQTVKDFEVYFSGVGVEFAATGDTLCMNDGVIKTK